MRTILTAAVLIVISHTPSQAYLFCSEPTAPYCATSFGDFNDGYEFEDCKREMERYASDIEDYVSCLSDASNSAISDYNDAVRSFNRRAGGY